MSTLIPGSDFGAPSGVSEYTIVTVDGRQKEGKSTVALSLPGPVVMFDLDKRADFAIRRAQKEWGKVIETCPLPVIRNIGTATDDKAQAMCREFLETFHRNYDLALQAAADKRIKSIIVDDATELWDLILMANYGKMTKIIPRDRQTANNEMREIVRRARSFPVNVAFVGKAKEVWIDDKPSGRFTRAGFKELGGLVDNTLFVELKKGTGREAAKTFQQITVTNCGVDRDLNGRTVREDEWEGFQPLPYVLSEIYGNSPMQWEDLDASTDEGDDDE